MGFRTQRDVERLRLPPDKKEIFHFDERCTGNSVRLQRTAKPAYVAWYTVNGKRRRFTLGSVAGVDLDDARRQTTQIILAARGGRDMGAERKSARAAAAAVMSVGELVDTYLREHVEGRLRSGRPATTALKILWAPLHALPTDQVTRRDVATKLFDLTQNRGPAMANQARMYLGACFSWGMKVGLVEHNPVVGTPKNEQKPRERVHSVAELGVIFRAAGLIEPPSRYGYALKFLMYTGQREGEVGGLVRAEIDFEKRLWTLPSQRSKNKLEHEVPLSRQALAILAALPEREGRPYIFSANGQIPASGWGHHKQAFDARIAKQQDAPLPHWTVHDLRRTFSTLMAEHDLAPPHIVEAILNHISGGHKAGVAGTYNRARYRRQMQIALQVWADWLDAAIEGRELPSNVVEMAS